MTMKTNKMATALRSLMVALVLLPFANVFAQLMLGAANVATVNTKPVQTFYNPLPEEDVYTALYEIEGKYEYKSGKTNYTPAWPVYSYTYISVFADNTIIYYDQYENGYEEDISNPSSLYSASNKQGTQIWGDGDLSNGCAPGTTDDILHAGSIIKLESAIEKDKIGTELYYNGRDKWAATKPCAASRAVWADQSQTMLASANEMYDTSFFGKEFIAPVGTNVSDSHELFEYTGFMIMAGENGATIKYSLDGKTASRSITLKEGETYFVNGKVQVGGYVKATSGNVQVELITGDIYDNFEARFIKLLPRNMWSNSYTCPVTAPKSITEGKTTYTCGNTVWIYNPNSTALTVTYKYRGNTQMKTGTITVPAKSTVPLVTGEKNSDIEWAATARKNSGTYLTANAPFYAISTFDSLGTDTSSHEEGKSTPDGGDNKTWDWGFALVADNALSSQILVGLGLGCDPTTSKTSENGAPIWVTAPYVGSEENKDASFNASTKVYVKYDAATSTGSMTDDLGNPCDAVYTLHPLEVLKIYNENAKTAGSKAATNGQTGMAIWTTDGTRIAAAWGEDPEVATRSEPGIDMGTGIPPMPDILISKDVDLVKDADDDGYAMVGDTLEYTVTIYNSGRIGISEVLACDVFDPSISYVPGTFYFKGVDADDKTLYSKRKLDDATFKKICDAAKDNDGDGKVDGIVLTSDLLKLGNEEPFLPAGGSWIFTCRTLIEDSKAVIPNTAYAANKYTTVHSTAEIPLRSKIGDYVWNDADKDGVQDENEKPISGVKVTLKDTEGNVVLDDDGNEFVTTTDENGYYIFSGLIPGDYVVEFETPNGFTPTAQKAGSDDAVDSDIDATGKTGTVTVKPGLSNLDVDAGFYLNIDASIKIVKTAGEAADGDVWTVAKGSAVKYTYVVTNTGKTSLKDVTVNDDKLGYVGKVDGILAPGKSATLTKTAAKVDADVTNIGDVEGTPCDSKGNPYTDATVTDDDDAVVEVYELGSIGDYVWVDVDGDGIQDAGEQGLPGVKVTLTDEDGNVKTTTTDENGKYLFADLVPGKYEVSFEQPADYKYAPANQGKDDSKDSDASVVPTVVELASGEDDLTVDCGLVFKGDASIKIVKTAGEAADGDVWTVKKGSAVKYTYVVTNTGKTPLVNVTVTDDKLGAVGTVEGVLLPGKSATLYKTAAKVDADVTNIGTVTGTPSDEDGTPVTDKPVTDDDDAVVDVYELGSIGDYVWVDVDGDGIQDAGEQGLPGVKVTLTDANGKTTTTTTDKDGKYLFDDLVPGTYKVSFEEPADYKYAPANQGKDDAKDSDATAVPTVVELASGENDLTVDCGLVFKGDASIKIVKTAGEAADGDVWTVEKGSAVKYTYVVTNTGKTPLVNVTVTDDKLGAVGTVEGVLLPGKSATLTKTAAKVDADVTNIGTVEGTPSDEDGTPVSDEKVTDDDDAVVEVYELGSIGDYVWVDVDGDGIQDEGEQGLPGVKVTLTDEDGNVKTTTTDENGKYLFEDLVPGKYEVSFEQPADYKYAPANQGKDDSKDSDASVVPTVVELASGEDDLTVDCGLVFKGDASIKIVKTAGEAADGDVWTVKKGSAVKYTYVVTNTGKTPLVNVTVTDDKLGAVGTVEGVLLPGKSATLYKTAAKIDADVTNIGTVEGTPSDEDGTPVTDKPVTDDDDAVVEVYELGSIGDYVWVDVDGDGIQDPDEEGLPGVKVTLTDEDGNVKTTTTDENGKYIFEDLEPGKYEVSFEEPADYKYAPANQGDDDAKDSDGSDKPVVVELASGENDTTVDCGLVFKGDASIQIVKTAGEAADGDVWSIKKGESVKYTYVVTNTGKTPLVDVTVTDDKLGEVGTVEGVLLPGASATLYKTAAKIDADVTNIGTVEGTPSDEDGTPVSDEKVTDDDDAVVEVSPIGRIGDKVWNDTDKDGIQDEDEMGVYNIPVELIDATTGEVIATTTTDAKGNYLFEDVEPGEYIVHFVPGGNWVIVDADQGDDDARDSDAGKDGYTKVIDFDGVEDLTVDCGLVGGVPPGICEWIDIAYYFNAVIGGNFEANGGDTEGDLLVVGDATLGGGYSVGSIGEGYGRARDAADIGHDTLVVGGSLTEIGTPDHNGNIVYGGDYNREGRTWGEGFTAREADPVTIDDEGNVPEDGTGTTLEQIVSDLTTFSEIAANLGETGDVTYEGGNWSGNAGYRNVFHVTNDVFEVNSLNSITITVPAGSKVLVNIYSESFNANMGGISIVEAETGKAVDPSLVLFNFVNAKEINTKNFDFPGAVLAPKAEKSVFSGGAINGFGFINGDVTTYVGFEFHDFSFKAFDCSRSDVVTQRPVLDLVVVAEDDANGAILRIPTGTVVRVSQIVSNPSDFDMTDVVLVDVNGREIEIGDLPAGASVVVSTEVLVDGDMLYTATVSGYGVDTKAYNGVLITDADSVKVAAVAAEEVAAGEDAEETEAVVTEPAAETTGTGTASGYQPRPDFEISAFEFTDKPMTTKSTFSAKVTVKNVGETVVAPGRIAIYVDQPAVIANLSAVEPAAFIDCDEAIPVGETKTFEFTGVPTPEAKEGIVHVRAAVDASEQIKELSELNNQFPLAAWLVSVNMSIDGEGIHLAWDSFIGQKFQVMASNDLKGFEPFGDVIEATSTTTSVTFPLDECEKDGKVYRFFKVTTDLAE